MLNKCLGSFSSVQYQRVGRPFGDKQKTTIQSVSHAVEALSNRHSCKRIALLTAVLIKIPCFKTTMYTLCLRRGVATIYARIHMRNGTSRNHFFLSSMASLMIKSAGLTDFCSLLCSDFMIEILSKYFAEDRQTSSHYIAVIL